MKWTIVRVGRWFFWARGMVFFRWMILKPYGDEERDIRLFRHELQHCYDQCAMGSRWKWYGKYLWLLLLNGYNRHPYEQNAEANEHKALTPQEMYWYRNGTIYMICN